AARSLAGTPGVHAVLAELKPQHVNRGSRKPAPARDRSGSALRSRVLPENGCFLTMPVLQCHHCPYPNNDPKAEKDRRDFDDSSASPSMFDAKRGTERLQLVVQDFPPGVECLF